MSGAVPPTGRPLRVLHFGTFDRDVGRNAILAEAMSAAGIERHVCHVPLWRDTQDKLAAVRAAGPGVALRLAQRAARAQARLARVARRAPACDVLLVGATGHLDLPLARHIAHRAGIPLVFDPLVSVTETLLDRRLLPPTSARARAIRHAEARLFRLPDLTLADTATHASAWRDQFRLPPTTRHATLPLGARAPWRAAPPYVARPEPAIESGSPFRILYFGQFIPLHGIETILHAAHLLRHHPHLRFDLVGRGQELASTRARVDALGLPNLHVHDTWLPERELIAQHVAHADLCLGLFGDSPKASRVVPYKVHAALAAGRPVLTADTPALRELLTPDHDVATVPPADPTALAEAILALAADPARRARLAATGAATHATHFAPAPLGARLHDLLHALLADHARPVGPRHTWRIDRVAETLSRHVTAHPSPPSSKRSPTKRDAPHRQGDAYTEMTQFILLDAGCGDGSLALALAARHPTALVLACDRDPTRVRRARTRAHLLAPSQHARILPFVADLRALPLATLARDDSRCAIACGEVLEHIADDHTALTELARILPPASPLLLTVPAAPHRLTPLDRAVGHHRRYTRQTLTDLLTHAGLQPAILTAWGWPFGRLYDTLIQRPVLRSRPPLQHQAIRWARHPLLAKTCHFLFTLDRHLEPYLPHIPPLESQAPALLALATKPPARPRVPPPSTTPPPHPVGPTPHAPPVPTDGGGGGAPKMDSEGH